MDSIVTLRACESMKFFNTCCVYGSVISAPISEECATRRIRAPSSSRTFDRMFDAINNATSVGSRPPAKSSAGKLTLLPLIAATYFIVSGGPFGLEDTVAKAGYGGAIVILLLTPALWSFPTALMEIGR